MTDRPAPVVLRVIDTVAALAFLQRRSHAPFTFRAVPAAPTLDTSYDTPCQDLVRRNIAVWVHMRDGVPATLHWYTADGIDHSCAWSDSGTLPAFAAATGFALADLLPWDVAQSTHLARSVSSGTTPVATLTFTTGTTTNPIGTAEYALLHIEPAPASPAALLADLCRTVESAIACRTAARPLPFVWQGERPAASQYPDTLSDTHVLQRIRATTRGVDDVTTLPFAGTRDELVLAAALARVDGADDACEPYWLALSDDQRAAVERIVLPAGRSTLLLPVQTTSVRDADFAAVLRARLRFQFRRVLQREATLRQGFAAEDIHRMRVSLRKLNSLIDCGLTHYDAEMYAQFRRGFRRVSRFLGVLRDVDSFTEHLLRILGTAQLPTDIATALAKIRTKALSELADLIGSERHATFLQSFAQFVCSVPESSGNAPSVHTVLHHRVSMMYEKLTTPMQSSAQKLDTEVLHDIRIDAKKLRYTIEAFPDVCSTEIAPLLRLLERLQQRLGVIQDAATAHQLLVEAHLMTHPDTKRVLQTLRGEAQFQRTQLASLWQRATSAEIRTLIAGIIAPAPEEQL